MLKNCFKTSLLFVLIILNTNVVLSHTDSKSSQSQIIINSPWIRVANQGKNTALYMTIENKTDDVIELLKVECPVAGEIEIHDTQKNAQNVYGMHHINSLPCPPGVTKLKTGDLHVMLKYLKNDLKLNQVVKVKFVFSNNQVIELDVKAQTSESGDCDCCD